MRASSDLLTESAVCSSRTWVRDGERRDYSGDHMLVECPDDVIVLDMEEVSSGLEDLVRYSMEVSPQVRPKALAGTWTDHVDAPEAARATLGRMLRSATEM